MAKMHREKCERAVAHFGLNDVRVRNAISATIHARGLDAFADDALADVTRLMLSAWKFERKLSRQQRARRVVQPFSIAAE